MLNLLPQKIKERHHVSSKLYTLGLVYFVLLVLLGLGAIGLATYNLTAAASLGQKQTEIDVLNAQKKKQTDITAKAAFIEDRLNAVGTYQEKVEWEKIIQQVADATPTDVQLTALKLTATGIDVSGRTTNRRAIVLFSERLSTQSSLSSTNIQSISDDATAVGPKAFTFTINVGVKK